jgi:hypothetical protein
MAAIGCDLPGDWCPHAFDRYLLCTQKTVPRRRTVVAQYIHIGILLISVPNLIVIGLMLLVFGLALLLKLPHRREN